MPLTSRFVASAKEPGSYSDGGGLGLILRVEATGRRYWLQRLTVAGRRRDIGLGNAVVVTLAEAREAARENARIVRGGGDPLAIRREAKAIPTFEAAARAVHADHRDTWRSARHVHDFIASLETHAFPRIGRMRIDHVGPADVLAVLSPIWTKVPATAQRVHQRISLVMKYAVAQEWRKDDPAAAITEALPKLARREVKRRLALPYAEVGGALKAIRGCDALPSIRRVLEFIILTAVRSGEARGATWGDIDLDAALWTIPGERKKGGVAHVVPLSGRAVELLREARAEVGEPDPAALVFPGARRGRPTNDSTLSGKVKALGVKADVHGFRSSFRDWAAERTTFPREVAEHALAHRVGNDVEQAYNRSTLLEQRRAMMEAWAAFVAVGEKA